MRSSEHAHLVCQECAKVVADELPVIVCGSRRSKRLNARRLVESERLWAS